MAAFLDHVLPGVRLGEISEDTVRGPGTYERNKQIYSSLAGSVVSTHTAEGQVCVGVKASRHLNLIPAVNSLVAARVTKVNARFCKCSIFAVDNQILTEQFHGVIRREDVRATQKDKVELHKCFRPTDIILAKVLCLGDSMSYLLSTAENELGVVVAVSEAGETMVPISWCEMQCPLSMRKELRKVARVQPRHINQSVVK